MVRWRASRVLAVSILVTIIMMTMASLLTYLDSASNELTRTLLQYRNSIMTSLQAIGPLLQRVGIDVLVDQLAYYIGPDAAMVLLINLLMQLPNTMSSIFLLLLTALLMLLEVPRLPGKFRQMMARPVEGMAATQHAIDSVSHCLILKTAISIIAGLVVRAMLIALDVRFAPVWGLLVPAFNYTPNIGSVLATIFPAAQALVFNDFYEALLVPVEYLLINLAFGNILEPRIMERGLRLSALMIFLSLIFRGWLLGPVGMLLSVPLTIIIKIALEQTAGG